VSGTAPWRASTKSFVNRRHRGHRVKRKGTVARTIDAARGTRVEVKGDDGVFRPHESLVRAI